MFKMALKTRRNRSPTLSSTPSVTTAEPHTLEKNLNTFFNAESASALLKPWLRLERGLRLQRFRTFADEYPGLSSDEKESLYKVLVRANDARVLNTKQQIVYEDGKIQSIRGLRMSRVGDADATFKIDNTRSTIKKRSKDDGTATEPNNS
jgi:hypothetical protein